MIFTREEILSEYYNSGEFVDKNTDLIIDLYDKIMMQNLDQEVYGQESHEMYCLMVAICLMTNNDNPTLPLPFDEDDDEHLPELMHMVDITMTLHKMENCGQIVREMKDGETYYRLPEKKEEE